jgi:hypothetical protein
LPADEGRTATMLKTIIDAPWQQAFDVLASGNPPMIVRILAINTVFFVLFTIRRVRGAPVMPTHTAIMVQSLLICANMMILYQDTILHLLHSLI